MGTVMQIELSYILPLTLNTDPGTNLQPPIPIPIPMWGRADITAKYRLRPQIGPISHPLKFLGYSRVL